MTLDEYKHYYSRVPFPDLTYIHPDVFEIYDKLFNEYKITYFVDFDTRDEEMILYHKRMNINHIYENHDGHILFHVKYNRNTASDNSHYISSDEYKEFISKLIELNKTHKLFLRSTVVLDGDAWTEVTYELRKDNRILDDQTIHKVLNVLYKYGLTNYEVDPNTNNLTFDVIRYGDNTKENEVSDETFRNLKDDINEITKPYGCFITIHSVTNGKPEINTLRLWKP